MAWFVALAAAWSVVALAAQVLIAWGGGRRDYSRHVGSPWRGVLYNFTMAMLPSQKETARLHMLEFAAGVVMHTGALFALIAIPLCRAWPGAAETALAAARPLLGLALVAALGLLVRRLSTPLLRVISATDDYVAVLATAGLLVVALLLPLGGAYEDVALLYTGLLLIYLPLGKLRHAVFFFVARANYGRRLGRRGVYPPARGVGE